MFKTMKRYTKIYFTKIFAILGMVACLIGTAFITTLSIVYMRNGDSSANPGFLMGMIVYGTAILSYLFYFIDAIFSIIKVVLRSRPVFNGILALLVVGAIPMTLWTLNAARLQLLWLCAYYLCLRPYLFFNAKKSKPDGLDFLFSLLG